MGCTVSKMEDAYKHQVNNTSTLNSRDARASKAARRWASSGRGGLRLATASSARGSASPSSSSRLAPPAVLYIQPVSAAHCASRRTRRPASHGRDLRRKVRVHHGSHGLLGKGVCALGGGRRGARGVADNCVSVAGAGGEAAAVLAHRRQGAFSGRDCFTPGRRGLTLRLYAPPRNADRPAHPPAQGRRAGGPSSQGSRRQVGPRAWNVDSLPPLLSPPDSGLDTQPHLRPAAR